MATYIWIVSEQEPFSVRVDENSRTVFSSNYTGLGRNIDTLEEDIADVLIAEGVLTALATDTFIGPKASLPSGSGPYTRITDTGGIAPTESHDGTKHSQFSFQVLVTGSSYSTAKAKARAIHAILDGYRP